MAWRVIKEIIWAIVFGIFLLFMFPGWGTQIVLKPEAIVTEDMIKIAAISKEADAELKDIILMPAPEIGDEIFLTGEDIRQILARRGIYVDVLGSVRIYKKVEKISSEEFRAWLLPKLKENGFALDQKTLPLLFIPRDSQMEVRLPDACSNFCYAYIIIKGKAANRSVPVRVRYDVAYKVWTVTRDVLPGEVLKDKDVSLESREFVDVKRAFSYTSSPVGYVVRHPLKKGDVINRNDVRITYIIRKGERIQAVYKNKGIFLQIPAIARENGRPGDVIKVQNIETKKIFFAKVIGDSLVEVCL